VIKTAECKIYYIVVTFSWWTVSSVKAESDFCWNDGNVIIVIIIDLIRTNAA